MQLTHWQDALAEHWGLRATLRPLDGEHDLNLAVQGPEGPTHVLKVMRPGCDPALVEMQVAAMQRLAGHPVPAPVPTAAGAPFTEAADPDGNARILWLITWTPGRPWGAHRPHDGALIESLGAAAGRLVRALEGFEHPHLARDLKWDLQRPLWAREHLDLIAEPLRTQLAAIFDRFEALEPALAALPKQAIHNDLNDWNILTDGQAPTGLLDFGDMVAAPVVCEVAIAAAYVMMGHERPVEALAAFAAGFHAERPLSPEELALIWPLALTRLAVSLCVSADQSRAKPDDAYVTISDAPARALLAQAARIEPDFVEARLRHACGMEIAPGEADVLAYLAESRGTFAEIFGFPLAGVPALDLSVASPLGPRDPTDLDSIAFEQDYAEAMGERSVTLGHYAEPRLIYTGEGFRSDPWPGSRRRTVHIAVDVFVPAGTELKAPLAGTVHHVGVAPDRLDYGGTVLLRHETPNGTPFFTLYGHLAWEVTDRLKPGQRVEAGETIALIGTREENVGWPPHVHLQLGLREAGGAPAWPGAVDPDDLATWQRVFPNPAALLNLPDEATRAQVIDEDALLERRQALYAPNLRLTYRKPLTLLRGWKHFMWDPWGRTYLDAYNNVPHVGHAHPRIADVAARQLRTLNTNTRYLHPVQINYAEALTALMPESLDTCFLLNSASEANELALRLARAATGSDHTITPRHGYHGNTNTALDISHYKFGGPGGRSKASWVHLVDVADTHRGPFRGDDAATRYADQVGEAIDTLEGKGHRLGAFIAETYPSVGGQIIPPPGYLAQVYAHVRAAGGVCIADEVQTGLGRLGHHMFAFEEQGAVPDIVVLGKPIGNGHPIGAVLTTRQIAAQFNNGMEFFSTFGGSTLSCAVGLEVLRIMQDERLPENAAATGDYLLRGLAEIDHPAISDVRGSGLFIGVDLANPDGSPATDACAHVKNRFRDRRILIGSEGPADNILKIRPPLTFGRPEADRLLATFKDILMELPA